MVRNVNIMNRLIVPSCYRPSPALSPGHSVESGRRLFAPYGMTDLVWRGCSGAGAGAVGMGHLSQCF